MHMPQIWWYDGTMTRKLFLHYWLYVWLVDSLQKWPMTQICMTSLLLAWSVCCKKQSSCSLLWRLYGHDNVSNHQPRDCLFNLSFRRRSKKILKPRVTGHCAGNSPVTGEFPAQMASNAENISNWWRHHCGDFRRHITSHKWPVTRKIFPIDDVIIVVISDVISLRLRHFDDTKLHGLRCTAYCTVKPTEAEWCKYASGN